MVRVIEECFFLLSSHEYERKVSAQKCDPSFLWQICPLVSVDCMQCWNIDIYIFIYSRSCFVKLHVNLVWICGLQDNAHS